MREQSVVVAHGTSRHPDVLQRLQPVPLCLWWQDHIPASAPGNCVLSFVVNKVGWIWRLVDLEVHLLRERIAVSILIIAPQSSGPASGGALLTCAVSLAFFLSLSLAFFCVFFLLPFLVSLLLTFILASFLCFFLACFFFLDITSSSRPDSSEGQGSLDLQPRMAHTLVLHLVRKRSDNSIHHC